jgi:hypothetical protein
VSEVVITCTPVQGLPPITVGQAGPLTAAYCAERAARAIDLAEAAAEPRSLLLLQAAERWERLGAAMASHAALVRREAG